MTKKQRHLIRPTLNHWRRRLMLLPLLRVKAAERATAATRTLTGQSCTQMMTMTTMMIMLVLKVSPLQEEGAGEGWPS